MIGFLVLCTVLSFMGRQTFTLHSKTGTYERAICAEEDHGRHPRGMTVYTGDDIHVWTDDGDQIELAVRIGLSVLYAVNTIPMILAFWLLSRVFSNVQSGRIFIEQNASFLLYYGLIQFLRPFSCRSSSWRSAGLSAVFRMAGCPSARGETCSNSSSPASPSSWRRTSSITGCIYRMRWIIRYDYHSA